MEYELKIGVQGHLYVPKIIREAFGENLKCVPNTRAFVLFSENTSPQQVIASLEVIISDLRLRIPQIQEHFCAQCAHWQNACMKGYSTRENSHTVACREFLEGMPSQ